MSTALELIHTVKAKGGQMRVEGDSLVIVPDTAGLPFIEALKEHKREIIRLLDAPSAPIDDPAEWREDFARWCKERAVSRSGFDDSGSVGVLLIDFAEWCIGHDAVPCQHATFEMLLEEAGFRCVDGMAAGLVLRADLEAHESFSGLACNHHARSGRMPAGRLAANPRMGIETPDR